MHIFTENLKKDHVLRALDARVKLVAALALLTMVLTYKGLVFPLFVLLLSVALLVWMRVPVKVFLLRFSEPLFIASVLVLIKLFFTGQNELFSIHLMGTSITGYSDGLLGGLIIAGRMLGAVSVIIVLGSATPFNEFMAGLSWLRVPRAFVEVLMFAYRYIFVLLEEALVIYNAQKNRLGYSSMRRGLSSFGTLSGSLTLKAFEHSQNTATAMAQRGYDGTIPVLRHKPFKPSDIIISGLFVAAMGCLWKIY